VKNMPKTETEARGREISGGNQTLRSAHFAVVLFMQVGDSHEAKQVLFPIPWALRARGESWEPDAALSERASAPVFRFQGRASAGRFRGRWMPASRESLFLEGLAGEPGNEFLPVAILRPDQAADSIGIGRMRRKALGAGLGARTLTENAIESGCVYREKRLTAERTAA
jgi:hypothetical protein